MTRKIGLHCFVRGRVQGVWYRASTKEQAEQLKLTGWAKNLPDGRVEVVVYGEEVGVKQLQIWLRQGPALAKVVELISEELPWQEYEGFNVL